MAVSLIVPMLATNRVPAGAWRWAVEPKLDGWRTMVHVDGGIRVRTRSGRDVTASLPELAGLVDAVPDGTVLDGELVAGQGRAGDFYRLAPQMMARHRKTTLTFVAFDVVHLAGNPIVDLAYVHRRRLLELLELTGPAWCTVSSFNGASSDVFDECARLGLEGLVAKRLDSRYTPGKRSAQWVKVKTADWKHRSQIGMDVLLRHWGPYPRCGGDVALGSGDRHWTRSGAATDGAALVEG